jgi:hypothetical protein
MTSDEPNRGEPAPPPDEAKPSQEAHRVAERRLRDEMARHRREEAAELRRFRYGCIGLIVVLLLGLVVGFVFF